MDQHLRFQKRLPEESGLTFANQLTNTEVFNILNYPYFYNGGGVAIGDLNGDQLPDIYFSSNLNDNALFLNEGNLQFRNITEIAGVSGKQSWSTGVSMVDVNADGRLDIYVNNLGDFLDKKGRNELFINQGNNAEGIPQFKESASSYGLDLVGFSTQAVFFDYDRDGDLDMFQVNHSVRPSETVGDTSQRSVRDPLAGDKLMRNDITETGQFTDVSEEAGIIGSRLGYGLGVVASDLNQDGWPDLYITNDFHEDDYLYINQKDGTFQESLRDFMGHTSKFSMGTDFGDINNDGLTDLVTLDMKPEQELIIKTSEPPEKFDIFNYKRSFGYYYQYARNHLQLNQGGGKFKEISQLAGVDATDWSWSALFCDLDNDAYQDLFITNGIYRRPNDMDFLKFLQNPKIARQLAGDPGPEDLVFINQMPSVPQENYAYQNQGNLQFENLAETWGLNEKGFSNGSAYADLDLDGDLDLVVNNLNAPATLYKNHTQEKDSLHFLQISLQGDSLNPFGIGTKVYLYQGNRVLLRENQPVRGFLSSVPPNIHIGLGKKAKIDSVKVFWPNGEISVKIELKSNQRILIQQEKEIKQKASPIKKPSHFLKEILLPGENTAQHTENTDFAEFRRESLIPHLLSTRGPIISMGDANGDGYEDFYLGGAAGSEGEIWVQNEASEFSLLPNAEIAADREYEDTDALFFDADQDGDQDLYIVSGGNQFPFDSPGNQDRLFLNDGNGYFTKWAVMPTQNSGSVVRATDLDLDGDLDLFVGRHVIPGEYGISPASYIFVNEGSGKFSDQTAEIAPELSDLGMISDGIWVDIDGDDDSDLILAGEWMPITVLVNEKGKLTSLDAQGLENTEGWWNRIVQGDFDNDGDPDFVVGNLGRNSSMKASTQEPCTIYIKDFDGNGALDPIICDFNEGKSYPIASRDEFLGQLIGLRKKFPQYADYANQTITDLFTEEELNGAVIKKAHLFASVYIENLGNGKFAKRELPLEAQFSPIFGLLPIDINQDGNLDLLTGGNFYGVGPALGRYDAGIGLWLKGDGRGGFKTILPSESGFKLEGEIRDIKALKTTNRKNPLILVSRNNQNIQLFKLNKSFETR